MRKRLLLGLLLLLPLVALAQEVKAPEQIITVTGSSQVFASPDEAIVQLGVQQQDTNASEAQDAANKVANRLIAALEKMGIAKKDVQTSQLSLYPQYNNPKPGEQSKITSYVASNILSVRLKDLSKVGAVIDAGVTAGVNNVQGIDFNLRDGRGPRAQALKDAVADARSKADAIAEALGVKITGVYDVSTDGGYNPPPRPFMARGAGLAMKDATPVESGQIEVNVNVTIRYKISG